MVKKIDINEFREIGYLQEVNRRFFHPLGLALEISQDEDGGPWRLGGVWDYRDDPEGILFRGTPDLAAKADFIDREWEKREPARVARLGYMVQPASPLERAVPKINFPLHKCSLALCHNSHRDFYMTAAQWIAEDEERDPPLYEWVSADQRQKAIETDEVWTLQWYPDTPIGFHAMAAADLDVLLEAALK